MKTTKIMTATILTVGLIMGSTSGAFASDHKSDQKPAPTAAIYAVQLAAYNTALANFDTATAAYKAQMTVYSAQVVTYKAAMQVYDAAWKVTVQNYKALSAVRENTRHTINATFDAAIHKANADFKIAKDAAKTADQKNAAIAARNAAVVAAIAARKVALDALNVKPAAPVKPVAPVKPIKPVAPVKPVAPKPGKTAHNDNSNQNNTKS